jgi:hypothetical protein
LPVPIEWRARASWEPPKLVAASRPHAVAYEREFFHWKPWEIPAAPRDFAGACVADACHGAGFAGWRLAKRRVPR